MRRLWWCVKVAAPYFWFSAAIRADHVPGAIDRETGQSLSLIAGYPYDHSSRLCTPFRLDYQGTGHRNDITRVFASQALRSSQLI
jgi:hypothetical protein